MALKAILFIICSLALIGTISAITCQHCNSKTNKDCVDPYPHPYPYDKNCSDGVTTCLKSYTTTGDLTTRSCGTGVSDDCKGVGLGITTVNCVCSADNCNSAKGVTVSVVSLVMAVLVPYVLWTDY